VTLDRAGARSNGRGPARRSVPP